MVSAPDVLIVSGSMTSPDDGEDVGKSKDPVEFREYVPKQDESVCHHA
jgi:hypothetical protein